MVKGIDKTCVILAGSGTGKSYNFKENLINILTLKNSISLNQFFIIFILLFFYFFILNWIIIEELKIVFFRTLFFIIFYFFIFCLFIFIIKEKSEFILIKSKSSFFILFLFLISQIINIPLAKIYELELDSVIVSIYLMFLVLKIILFYLILQKISFNKEPIDKIILLFSILLSEFIFLGPLFPELIQKLLIYNKILYYFIPLIPLIPLIFLITQKFKNQFSKKILIFSLGFIIISIRYFYFLFSYMDHKVVPLVDLKISLNSYLLIYKGEIAFFILFIYFITNLNEANLFFNDKKTKYILGNKIGTSKLKDNDIFFFNEFNTSKRLEVIKNNKIKYYVLTKNIRPSFLQKNIKFIEGKEYKFYGNFKKYFIFEENKELEYFDAFYAEELK